MSLKTHLKKVAASNWYLHDFIIQKRYREQNKQIRQWIEGFSEIDSILNYGAFKEAIIKWKHDKSFSRDRLNAVSRLCGESLYYGYLRNMYEYAGMQFSEQDILLPFVEHGIDWYEQMPAYIEEEKFYTYINQGTYKNQIIHDRYPYIPVFNVGPYINYANLMYQEDEILEMKKSFGKTLLVFPFHCYELSDASYDTDRFVDDIMSRYAKDFDTVLVSVYWNDVEDELYKKFEDRGARLISSGFRSDPYFISRQKTVIMLSDATLGNDLGTHIGYSLALGRPHILLSNNKVRLTEDKNLTKTDYDRYESTLCSFFEDFSYDNYLKGISEDTSIQYLKFWGGNGLMKTPEEMRGIFEISEDILHHTHGFQSSLSKSVYRILEEYRTAGDIKYQLLSDSLGSCYEKSGGKNNV